MEETNELKVGDYACFTWKKPDGSSIGASEGLFLGLFGDETIGKFLVFDRTCYKDSFKASVFSLGVHDLKLIPVDDIAVVQKRQLRERAPNFSEHFRFIIDAFYYSNVDFDETLVHLQNMHNLGTKIIGNDRAEQYGISIKNLPNAEEASINITCKGIIQITCLQKNLDNCLDWLSARVKLTANHKRLVLFPKSVSYRLNDSFKENSMPSEELMNEIGAEEGPPITLPIGWQTKLSERNISIQNLITNLFSEYKNYNNSEEEPTISRQENQFGLNKSGINVEKFIGNKSPIMRLHGIIKSKQEEHDMMNMWLNSRNAIWQWFDSGPIDGGRIEGKVIIHDITINRKKASYIIGIRMYSGDHFSNEKLNKNVHIRLSSKP